MGKYLNPGNTIFKKAVESEIYVDKTGMINYINSVVNTEQSYICVSRQQINKCRKSLYLRRFSWDAFGIYNEFTTFYQRNALVWEMPDGEWKDILPMGYVCIIEQVLRRYVQFPAV